MRMLATINDAPWRTWYAGLQLQRQQLFKSTRKLLDFFFDSR